VVERRADTAGVDEEGPARAGSPELLVAVAEEDRLLRLTGEHPLLAGLRVGCKASMSDADQLRQRH
jgi:hypothetical protein